MKQDLDSLGIGEEITTDPATEQVWMLIINYLLAFSPVM
jgi:hypothetical protein